jgi:hypothetical protein
MKSLILILLVLLTFSLSSCVSVQQTKPLGEEFLLPSATLRFDDVPYPAGFKVLTDKSFILESGGVRAGVLRYIGKTDLQNAVLFYKTYMPKYNWALLNVVELGESVLNFERENESCVITLRPRGSKVEISISLAPKSPMPAPEKPVESIENIKVIESKKPVKSK